MREEEQKTDVSFCVFGVAIQDQGQAAVNRGLSMSLSGDQQTDCVGGPAEK